MKFDELTFVTGNSAKVKEAENILKIKLNVLGLELEEIQEIDLEKIAFHKLDQAYVEVGKPVIVDDVSLEIDYFNKFPGPLVKWVLKASGGDASVLLKMLESAKDRSATAKLVIGYSDGNEKKLFYGEVRGKIAYAIKGDNGFGWDPVFIPDGQNKTYAEMLPEEKAKISHRRKALDKLSDFLKSKYDI